MERLTMNNGLCQMVSTEICISQKDCYSCPHGRKCFKRLATYEDTRLEPDDIEALRDREQGLAELLVNVSCGCAVSYTRLTELAQAEKDGRLVAYMPGDKVYDRFGTPWIIESSEIHLIGAEIKHLYRCGHPGTEDYSAMYEEELQTREEAEAALKKREEACKVESV